LPAVAVTGFHADWFPVIDRELEVGTRVPDAVGGQLGDHQLDGAKGLA
jgi:hypothetical protein